MLKRQRRFRPRTAEYSALDLQPTDLLPWCLALACVMAFASFHLGQWAMLVGIFIGIPAAAGAAIATRHLRRPRVLVSRRPIIFGRSADDPAD